MPSPCGRRDLLHDLEGRVGVPERLAEPPRRRQRADAPDAVVEADDEAHPHHLAGGHHVHAGALLVENGRLGGVLHQLAHVEGAEATGLHSLAGQPHPAGQAVAAHHGSGQDAGGGDGRGHGRSGPVARASRNAAIAALCSGESSIGAKAAFMRSRNVVAVEVEGERRQLLARADGGGGEREHALHCGLQCVRELRRGHHAVHQVQALSLAGGDVLAEQDQLARAGQPDQPRQAIEGERWDEPLLHRGEADEGGVTGEPVVADQRELKPAAQRVAVDAGHEEGVHVLDGHHGVFPRAKVAGSRTRRARARPGPRRCRRHGRRP